MGHDLSSTVPQGVKNTRLENLLAMAQTFFRSDQFCSQERQIRATPIFQFAAFEEIPDSL